MSEALDRQVTGTVDLGGGLVLPVVTIPHVKVCQLMTTVGRLLEPYADARSINAARTAALHNAIVLRNHDAATVAGTEITLTYNRCKAEWEIRGLPNTSE